MIEYLRGLKTIVDFCEGFKKDIIKQVFTDSKTKTVLENTSHYYYCWYPRYRRYIERLGGIVSLCDMLGIESLEKKGSVMQQRVSFLNNPDAIQQRVMFEGHLGFIEEAFVIAKEEIESKINLLEKEEMDRLDEALNCYINGCIYSTIAMSVSAIEFRLLNLMQSVKKDSELEKLTLGELIAEYLKNNEEYKNIIPRKHEPLLSLCNQYRIFSVHPKKEKITKAIATSIINMTFAFLLDEDLKRKAEV
jgi:hypothetical protein